MQILNPFLNSSIIIYWEKKTSLEGTIHSANILIAPISIYIPTSNQPLSYFPPSIKDLCYIL